MPRALQFIGHANCQLHCMKYFYREMSACTSLPGWVKVAIVALFLPFIPVFCILYLVYPSLQVSSLSHLLPFLLPSYPISITLYLGRPERGVGPKVSVNLILMRFSLQVFAPYLLWGRKGGGSWGQPPIYPPLRT